MAHPQSRLGVMSQLDANGKHRLAESPQTPVSPTMEQLLRGSDGSKWSVIRNSQSFGREHDMEEDHTPHRKSVLAKVKEKAKKWRNTLSKKKHNETPSWGVSLEDEDDDEEDEDPEYLGAPMYESEMAPEGYKETARQHPRANPVISEKHVLTSSLDSAKCVRTKSSPRSGSGTETGPVTPNKADVPKSISETMAEKLAPAYASVTEATYAIASKIQSLAFLGPETKSSAPTTPKSPEKILVVTNSDGKSSLAPIQTTKSSSGLLTPSPRARSLTPQESASIAVKQEPTELEKVAPVSAPAAMAITSNDPDDEKGQTWDKGVSVTEYIMQKLEPGEDEKALSEVISRAISPKKNPGEASVVEKVREAVTSLLRMDDSSQAKQQRFVYHSAKNSSSNIPISTNAHEVVEEETCGRMLQAN